MKGPRYIVKDPLVLYWQDKEFSRHEERIHKILKENHRSKIETIKKKDELLKESVFKNKLYASAFTQHENLLKIDKDNQVLLNKILSMRRVPLKKNCEETEKNLSLPKTLNLTRRKLNAEKIEKENLSFAKRLAQPASAYGTPQIKKDIEKYLKLRRHMTKMNFFPKLKKRNSESSLFQPTKNGDNSENERNLITNI